MKRSLVTIVLVLTAVPLVRGPVHERLIEKKFKNCTELRKSFPKGVARDAKSAGNSGAAVNALVYQQNASSDRDKDGIACEVA
jgi:Excalibur calcium-binding domain